MSDESVPAPSEPTAGGAPLGAFDLLLVDDSAQSQHETAEDSAARPLPPAAPADGSPASAGSGGLALERHEHVEAPATNVVDWVALALAVIAPPIGVLASIAAILIGIRRNGYAATIAKAALIVAAVLTVVLIAVLILVGNTAKKQAAHDAIVSSSAQWCSRLTASGDLGSSTYGFPESQDTIPDSISAIQKYQTFWAGLAKIAPAGIKAGTQRIATTAGSILTTVSTSRVVDDSSNATQMQEVIGDSGVGDWVSSYCK